MTDPIEAMQFSAGLAWFRLWDTSDILTARRKN
jgi:hypothetical protein